MSDNCSAFAREKEEKKKYSMRNWEIIRCIGGYRLRGFTCREDERFGPGECVTTSLLARVDFAKREAETANSVYSLL